VSGTDDTRGATVTVDRLDDDVRKRVEAFVADLRDSPVTQNVLTVVIVGSASRGEQWPATDRRNSDIDVMVVTRSSSPLLGRRIARILEPHHASGLEGGQVPLATLSRHRTLINYEARWSGCVVDGDAAVLTRIPMRGPDEIPHWEAVRLLLNRVMEHVKLRSGSTTPETVAQKSYEALGEALLVLERRYRPTFRDRLDEIREQPLATSAELNAAVVRALERRAYGRDAHEPQAVDEALSDLYAGLDFTLTRYLGTERPIRAQLDHLGRRHRHILQRLYWAAVGPFPASLSPRALREDPSIGVWRAGLDVLDGHQPSGRAQALVHTWARCPQILDAKDLT
jgi:predicted nucleotidyltransferase